MTAEQKAEYLQHPYHCPYCKSGQIEAQTFDGEAQSQAVVCLKCGKQWRDVYTLTDIEPTSA